MPDTETETKPKKAAAQAETETKPKKAAAQAETETKPKKAEGWDRKVRHLGTFVDFRKREFPAYLEFKDVEGDQRGFALYCSSTHKEFKPNLRVLDQSHLAKAKVNFAFSGKTEPADKAKSKPISKAKRNAAIAAAAPKVDEDDE